MKKKALITGITGQDGGYLAKFLLEKGYEVFGIYRRLSTPNFWRLQHLDIFDKVNLIPADLVDPASLVEAVKISEPDEIYHLAADMGGAGFVFTGDNDADIMHNSALVNLNMLEAAHRADVGQIFYSSSACMYPEYNQLDPDNPKCAEDSAYPAAPDSEYGWEKLFSERLYLAFHRNYSLNIRIARFHNIFGPEGTWTAGREKHKVEF